MISNSDFLSMLRETVPQYILSTIIERKLHDQGVVNDRPLVEAIARHVLSGSRGSFKWNGRDHGNLTVTFTTEDCHEIAMCVDEFLKQLPTILQDCVRDGAKIVTTTLTNNWAEQLGRTTNP